MKLSDAILLGSTLLAPQAGRQYSAENQSGCALGMAAVATGCTFRKVQNVPWQERRTLGVEGVWGTWTLELVRRPCKCFFLIVPRKLRVKEVIAHLFDYHVVHKKNWTLEQLVDWVRTVEPAEPAQPRLEPPRLEVVWRRTPQTEPWRESARRLDLKDFEDVVRVLVSKHGKRPRPSR
jgi:hypothetical protein